MSNPSAAIELRSVVRLLTDENGDQAKYWVPSYQRGYRWNKIQVFQLLDDIWEFIQAGDGRPKSSFYCLQPLVVKKMNDGRYEVVDGQQRLTTIHIILSYLKDIVAILDRSNFQIDYETRDATFLHDIDLDRAGENVDFYHIGEAWRAVEEWVSKHSRPHALKLIQHLLNDDEIGQNVKVIWYELTLEDDAVAAFTRLNVGKIPLTEAELIRALFLRRAAKDDLTGSLQLRIAYQWDRIEHSLQDDAFWYFLQNSGTTTNRIGLIFNLASELWNRPDVGDDHSAFSHFADALQGEGTAEKNWKKINDIFLALEEWYEDRYLYHVIGLVLHHSPRSEMEIGALLTDSRQSSKRDFRAGLRKRILRLIFDKRGELSTDEIRQEVDEQCRMVSYTKLQKARKLLLLFNIATLLENEKSNIRFQFDSFKKDTWDIEHIRSVSGERPDNPSAQKAWLQHCLAYLRTDNAAEAAELAKAISQFLDEDATRADDLTFEKIDGAILIYFKEAQEGGDNALSNLTLLDSRTNRGYKNSVFAVKRDILLKNDQAGTFVPLCTRNVFLKCYSSAVGNVTFWTKDDAKAYFNAICRTLTKFMVSSEVV
ncbi:MAG: DUF262 domain-containing protein [Mesorhizobium sp.]|uniref:DUF262 domain-containing protein n=1 Tax=Mesorhizobium sp. TaxID=1871066 RepID=UPI001224EE7F|nr:DUF262 domain-containing protein [Mesorhizobium sp.]TIL27468.1 MAG: DUF262 domain-containing protein [Mesorhizobium sp.]